VIKEGLYEDPERRDALFKIARFASTKHPAGDRTLADNVKDLRENQTAIFYLTGDDAKRLAASPQLEGFRARGVEVLLLADPVDAFWVSTAAGFDGKPFKSISQGDADIKAIPLVEGQTPPAEATAEVATLIAYIKQTLEGEIADARASARLTDSVACLVAPEFGPDRQLERMLAAHGRVGERVKPVLEVNATHPLTAALARRFKDNADKALVDDAAWLILDEARLVDGETLKDAPAFAARLRRVMEKALG
jgi:molecular chaperone HtpG